MIFQSLKVFKGVGGLQIMLILGECIDNWNPLFVLACARILNKTPIGFLFFFSLLFKLNVRDFFENVWFWDLCLDFFFFLLILDSGRSPGFFQNFIVSFKRTLIRAWIMPVIANKGIQIFFRDMNKYFVGMWPNLGQSPCLDLLLN